LPDGVLDAVPHGVLDGVPYDVHGVLDCVLDGLLCALVLPDELGMLGVAGVLCVLSALSEHGAPSVLECLVFMDASVRKWLTART
jgi:hypothetical protein